jgi:hypothetical protein
MAQRTLKGVSSGIVALALWLISSAIALAEIVYASEIAVDIYVRRGGTDPGQAIAIRQWTILAMALVCVAFIFGSGEYHRTHVGQKASWRLFAISFLVELVIYGLYRYLYL